MGRTLYQLADDYLELWELCIDEDADIQNVVSKMLAIDDLIDSKVANGIAIIQDLKFHAQAMDDESKRLAARKKALDNKIDWLKNYYLDNLQAVGKLKVLTPRGTMSVVKAGGKRPLKIDNEQLIPDSFKFNVPIVNKDALRSALESGQIVAGAHLEDRGKYLKIF